MFYNHSTEYLQHSSSRIIISFEVIVCSILYLSPVNIMQP